MRVETLEDQPAAALSGRRSHQCTGTAQRSGSRSRSRCTLHRYLDEVRENLARGAETDTMFLNVNGRALGSDVLSRTVSAYVTAGAPDKHGSCHLFRHTAATLMLDAGADVRHIAEILGHAKLETTMTYTRVSMAKLHEVHARCHPAERAALSR